VSAPAEGLLTAEVGTRRAWLGRSGRGPRRLLGLLVVLGLVWSLSGAGVGRAPLVNPGGWPQLRAFFAAALAPETSPAFLQIVAEAALVTAAYAVLGTALALLLGVVGGFAVSATFWQGGRRAGRRSGFLLARGALALPRGLHEAVWALLLVNVLGLDPLVAVLAIGLPYGAITAKVYADLLDEAPREPYEALLAAGAGRGQALLYGLLPLAAGDLVSYAFYRLECAVRAAVVLGVIGAGGLGFELELSFSALRYGEMWTVIAALVGLCAAADLASATVRARLGHRDPLVAVAMVATAGLTVWSWVYLAVRPDTLWSPQTLAQVRHLLAAGWPPALDPATLERLWSRTVETFQMSLLAGVWAFAAGLAAAVLAARTPDAGPGRQAVGLLVRGLLLLARAVPPPVWALLALFVLYPGLLPGAVALAAYNAGVLGRLMAEAQESLPDAPAQALRAQGASRGGAWLYGVLPRVLPKDLAYGLYRWEVAARETVVVGLVGAGGLGQTLARETAAFSWPGVVSTVLALVVLTFVVDLLSTLARRVCR